MRYENLKEVAQRFCGAILFDGDGCALVVDTNQPFSFETLSAYKFGSDEKVIFETVDSVDLECFGFDDLPYNVKDPNVVEATIIKELNSLNKTQREKLLTKLKELE